MERWKVFFNVGGVLAAVGSTFLVLGLARSLVAFWVTGATHLVAGCALVLVGTRQRSGNAAHTHECGS